MSWINIAKMALASGILLLLPFGFWVWAVFFDERADFGVKGWLTVLFLLYLYAWYATVKEQS